MAGQFSFDLSMQANIFTSVFIKRDSLVGLAKAQSHEANVESF